ncbi:MAG: hypothetical protein MJ166_05485 [Clostridia bacterium]|nr:hypothetical protein [Clostridia bacterium]
MENNNNVVLTPAGNDKKYIDELAMQLMRWGIMSTAFAAVWPIAFLGIIFSFKAKKFKQEFIALEGRTYNCAKVGDVCGKVGFIMGIVMTCFAAIYILFMIIYFVMFGVLIYNS